jgi:butyryl-CoA dehydrogenase
MHLDLTEEQTMLRDMCRQFAREELLPKAGEMDERAEFPREQVARMAELGLLGVTVPTEYDGAGMDSVSYALAMEEISAGCASCGIIMSVNNSLVCEPIVKFGTEEQKRSWLPDLAQGRILGCFALSEPSTGSDAAAQKTSAVLDGDAWVLNGSKNFVTSGNDAQLCIVFAMGDKNKGVKGINAYLLPLDVDGVSVAKNEKKLGIKASSTSQINLDDVRVGRDSLLGEAGEGFKIAMSALDCGRIGVATQALGIARQALEEARDYALERNAFGGPIADLQAIQFMRDSQGRETAVHDRSVHGQALCERDVQSRDQQGAADLRWLWLLQGLSGGAALARRAHHGDLRRHERGATAGDRAFGAQRREMTACGWSSTRRASRTAAGGG